MVEVTLDEAIATFTAACEAVGGRVSRAGSVDEIVAIIREHLGTDSAGPGAFAAWDDEVIGVPGVIDALIAAGAERLDARVHADAATRAEDMARLDRAAVGITGAHAALTDTGTVVLRHGVGRPRLVSLLPPVHVAVVPIARMFDTFASLIEAEPDLVRGTANVVLVTGPSRTADIEMTLTRGVHGPRVLHVVLVG